MDSINMENISDTDTVDEKMKIGDIYFINKTFRILCNCGTKFKNIKMFTKHFLQDHLYFTVLEEIISNSNTEVDDALVDNEYDDFKFETLSITSKDLSHETSKSDSETYYNIIKIEHNYVNINNEENLFNEILNDKTDDRDKIDCLSDGVNKNDCMSDDYKDCCMSDLGKNDSTTDYVDNGYPNDEDIEDYAKEEDDDLTFISVEEEQNEDEQNIKTKPWNCSLCGESFAKRKGFVNHKLSVHNVEHVPGKEEAFCKLCGEYFKDAKGLKKHEYHKHFRSTSPKYKCKWCDTMFIKPEYRTKHENTKHDSSGNKIIRKWNPTYKHICETCGSRFSLPWKLREHIRIEHTGERPLKCDMCSKSFARKRELRIHKYSHMEEPPYKCDYCDKGFFEKSMLNLHEMIHTGSYKVECKLCEKKFRCGSDLNRHMRRTHKIYTKSK